MYEILSIMYVVAYSPLSKIGLSVKNTRKIHTYYNIGTYRV